MIIRHDLQLVFLHVPKCAGKELRELLMLDAEPGAVESLFNYSYSPTLHRHVDLAHLPMSDLIHWPQYRWIDCYTTVAAVRNPYARLLSAANEYFRQRSATDEALVITGRLTASLRQSYMEEVALRHSQHDPRYIHSLPITWFTHQGIEPKVDLLLRCETLAEDVQAMAERLGLPQSLREAAAQRLQSRPAGTDPAEGLTEAEIAIAHALYDQDFATFGYPRQPDPQPMPNHPALAELSPTIRASHAIPLLNRAERVEWHWGVWSEGHEPGALSPTR
jgi:hypothetical protein